MNQLKQAKLELKKLRKEMDQANWEAEILYHYHYLGLSFPYPKWTKFERAKEKSYQQAPAS